MVSRFKGHVNSSKSLFTKYDQKVILSLQFIGKRKFFKKLHFLKNLTKKTFLLSEHILWKESIVILKKFDFEI